MAASARDIPSRHVGAAAPALARAGALLARHGALLALAAWTAIVTALLARYSLDSHLVFTDESNAVLLGRVIESAPSSLFEGTVARGPERMTSWLAAIAAALTDDPPKQYELLHLMCAFAQGLVVVPVWLAGRQLGLGRWSALAPAMIASTGSFAFYGTTTLNAAVGLLSASFMLWAILRALRRPGVLSDLLICVTLAATVLSRIGWAPLVGAIVPAILAAAWFERPDGERPLAWLKALPLRLVKRHPLLALGALGLLVALLRMGIDPLIGGELYGGVRLRPHIELGTLWDNTRLLLAHLAIGMALVPFVLALPVLARGLLRPPDPVEGGFAWLTLGFVAILSYAYYDTMNEDRYFAVLAAPIVIAGALAVFKRRPPLWSIAVSGAAVTAIVATSYRWPSGDVYSYFVAPTSQFFGNVVLGKASYEVPGSRATIAVVVVAGAAIAAVALAAVWRSRLPRAARWTVAALALAGLVAYQLSATIHPAKKFVDVVAMKDVPGDEFDFVDDALADGHDAPIGTAEPLAVDGGIHPDLAAQMPMLQVFNSALGYRFSVNVEGAGGLPPGSPAPPPAQAKVDWRSGEIVSERPPPEVLLTTAGQETVGFDGRAVAVPPVFAWAGVQRLSSPLRVEWILRDANGDHFADRGRPIRARVFPHGAQRCLSGLVNAHPLSDHPVRYRLAGAGKAVRGTVSPGEPRPFRVRLPGTRPLTLRLHGGAARLPDGSWRAPALFNLSLDRCR